MQGFKAIAERIKSLGVTDVFTYTSKDICELVAELSAIGVTIHHTRHEQVAMGMADGYFRSSGRVGVVIVGQGVGLTNCMNALLTAAKARSRVLVLVGEVPGSGSHLAKIQRKHIDQRGLLDALEVPHVDLGSADSVAADIEACYRMVEGGHDPLVVNVPDELMQFEVGHAPSRLGGPPQPVPLSTEDRDTLVDLLTDSWTGGRVVILAGRGAVRTEARADLERLADAIGALLATSVVAKDFFRGSPWAIGISGTFASPIASELLQSATLVLSFGASLNYDTTYDGTIFGKARIVHIDNDAAAIGRFLQPDLSVIADAGTAAHALADEVTRRGHHADGYRTGDTAARIAGWDIRSTFTDTSGPNGLDMRALMVKLDELLPAERTISVDGGNFQTYPTQYMAAPDSHGYMWAIEYGSVGCSLGHALGAALGRPDRLSVLVIGDGGMMMTLADLDTAVRDGIRLLVVVCNNSALAAELHYLVRKGYSGDDTRFENPSFETVAKALGLEALTVRTIGDLDALKKKLPGLRGPLLLDCITSNDVVKSYTSFAREKARKQGQLVASA